MVQARTRIMNQLQAVALNEGLRCKKRLWREHGREQLESIRLAPWASRRRRDLLELLDRLNPTIAKLSKAIEQEAEELPAARCLMTHPGVGPLTALAFVLIIGRAERFQCGKQVASYLGLVPRESSSGNRRRLGHITKEGSSMLLLAGGSGPGHSAPSSGVAQQLFPLDDAPGPEDRQGCDGPATRHSFVLDVAQGMGLRASQEVRFARGPTRNRRWCAVEHRVIDWAARSSFRGGVRSSNHDQVCDRRDAWVGPSSDLNSDCERALVGHGTFSTRAKWRSSPSACSSMLENYLTLPTL